MNLLMGRKRVINVCEHLRMKSFLYIWGSQCLSQFSILANLLIWQHGHFDNWRSLGRFGSHLNCVLLHHIQHKQLYLYMNSLYVQISGIENSFEGWECMVVFLFSGIQRNVSRCGMCIFYTLRQNTEWWEFDIHGCYSPVKIAFAPFAHARTIDEYDVTMPVPSACVT